MKRLLNTLYVTSQGAYLSKEGDTVHVKVENETKLRIPIHNLGSIVCFGQVSCSPFIMGLCGERNVSLAFFTENGRFMARVEGPVSGNVLLRRAQYRKADDQQTTGELARSIVVGKIANSRIVLMRALRDYPGCAGVEVIEGAIKKLARIMEDMKHIYSIDWVRGKEGEAARIYFEAFDYLITGQKDEFYFKERTRRPPLDNMNALLSFLYTLLTHDVASALEGVGLDPAVGFLHRDRPGRPGLALDLMEELRPILADRLALTLVNRRQVKGKGFIKRETGAVVMDDATRKEVLNAYQIRKRDEITHAFLDEKISLGLVPHVQAMLLARYFRGDLDGYPPFRWR
ncbi:MAG: type I-C CRISPR-associated endonuclease Cas1c [Peptococcaceae bacterium]|jgi:CRISPR-associated protein Cas1|nr:type I-C CRISPR-associated endonuclease Cas1c [Peptococcaceae bacterium]